MTAAAGPSPEVIADSGQAYRDAVAARDDLTPAEAARAAFPSGRLTLAELEARIRADREQPYLDSA